MMAFLSREDCKAFSLESPNPLSPDSKEDDPLNIDSRDSEADDPLNIDGIESIVLTVPVPVVG